MVVCIFNQVFSQFFMHKHRYHYQDSTVKNEVIFSNVSLVILTWIFCPFITSFSYKFRRKDLILQILVKMPLIIYAHEICALHTAADGPWEVVFEEYCPLHLN